MKIRTSTLEQRQSDAWVPVFAFMPVQVDDGDYRWLEIVERRELKTMQTRFGTQPCAMTVQYRARGSSSFWPPYPFKAGEGNVLERVGERRSNRARVDNPYIERTQQTEK